MANPEVKDIPELTWVKVATEVKYLLLIRVETTMKYYWTYRMTTEDAPAVVPDKTSIPDEAVRLFEDSNREPIESSEAIDVYVISVNSDNDSNDAGKILISTVNNFRDIAIQDQNTPAVISKFYRLDNISTLAESVSTDDQEIEVLDSTGFTVGDFLIVYSRTTERYYLGTILSITDNTIGIDSPLDSDFPIGSAVTSGPSNMGVNGSVTPQVFSLRGESVVPGGIDLSFDLTRIIFNCVTDTAVDLSKFGDIEDGIPNGLVLRKRNGEYFNVFNIKTNSEMAGIMYDWTPLAATNPAQGQDGFLGRLTFAGQSKIGVAIRLAPGEDLEFIVQDDLSSITKLEVVAEGHVVEP